MKNKKLLIVLTVIFVLSALLLSLVACSEAAAPTVTFEPQNGSAATVVKFNSDFALPEDPVKEGMSFSGWYLEPECTTAWTVPATLTEDITVYAGWISSYTVTFDPQNDTGTVVVTFDSDFALPVNPTREGYLFEGWYADSNGTTAWTVPATLTENITVYAKWSEHTHDFGDNYFMFVKCSSDNCEVIGRNASTDSAKENFQYTFTDERAAEIDQMYTDLVEKLGVVSESDYEDMFEEYDDELSYIVQQYQCANVFYYTYFDETATANFQTIEAFYNKHVSNYYGLFAKVYNSSYKDEFFAGWSQDEIDQVLALSNTYGDEEYTAIQDQIDTVLHEYDELSESNASGAVITAKYKELVALNNQLAKLQGYDNYMDYAYEVVYERDYTPTQVKQMRAYVKKYIGPLLTNAYNNYSKSYNGMTSEGQDFYYAFQTSIFKDSAVDVTNYIANYFQALADNSSAQPIDYFQSANELFKNGNYYLGVQEAAFTYWIPSLQQNILYFGSGYQGAFTFVHEFGHYYNGIYNNGLSLCMDHDETQSQGDEMLFLAWLSENITQDQRNGYKAVRDEQIYSILITINIACAVDEFEQAVYTDSYNGKSVSENYTDYGKLFKEIATSYNSLFQNNTTYWEVGFHSAGYYISYAMSALPSLEIYVDAKEDFASAKASYLKLYTFADDTTGKYVEVETNDDGSTSKTVVATYEEILHYCGLSGPFDEELYTKIQGYFG